MKIFLTALAAVVAAWFVWLVLLVVIFAPDPVGVAPEAEIIPEHVEYFRSEERQKRLDVMRDELRDMETKNDKRIAQACAADHLNKEYCK